MSDEFLDGRKYSINRDIFHTMIFTALAGISVVAIASGGRLNDNSIIIKMKFMLIENINEEYERFLESDSNMHHHGNSSENAVTNR